MKTLVLVIANLMVAASTVYASGEIDIENAAVGQIMSLKKDVVFDEGVKEKVLSSTTLQLPTFNGEKIDVEVYCSISRDEDGEECPDYKKTKVMAGKNIVIRSTPFNSAYFHDYTTRKDSKVLTEKAIIGSIKKTKCTYTLTFACEINHSTQDFRKSILEIAAAELRFQASQNFKIQKDPTEPTPWP